MQDTDPLSILPPVYRLQVELRSKAEARLPGWLGSTLHGALGGALRAATCSRSCAAKHPVEPRRCPYVRLFEPVAAPEGTPAWIAASPAPRLAICPPAPDDPRVLAAGDHLAFSVLLLGDAAAGDVGYLLAALERMAAHGLGRGRGRFELTRVTSGTETVWEGGSVTGRPERATPADIAGLGLVLSTNTPLRVVRGGELVRPRFEDLVGAAARRVVSLAVLAGEPNAGELRIDALVTGAATHRARIEASWEPFHTRRWSSRQRRAHAMHGYLGELRVDDAGPYLDWLRAGALAGIGKGTALGFGHVELS